MTGRVTVLLEAEAFKLAGVVDSNWAVAASKI